jgi:hypothetical protein
VAITHGFVFGVLDKKANGGEYEKCRKKCIETLCNPFERRGAYVCREDGKRIAAVSCFTSCENDKKERKQLDDEKRAKEKRIAEEKRLAEEKKSLQRKQLDDEKRAKEKRIAEEKRAKEKRIAEEKRLAVEKKSLQGIQPESQKEFLNIVLSYRDKYKNSKNEIKKTLQRKKRIKSLKTLFESNLSFQYWVGEVSSMDTNKHGDASIGIIIDSTNGMKKNDSLVAELAKKERDLQGVIFAQGKMNWLIPGGIVLVNNNQKIKMDDDLFDTIAEMEVGDKVIFSGSFELHPEEQTGRSKGWYVHTANPTEKGAMTSPVFVVGYSDIKKVNK